MRVLIALGFIALVCSSGSFLRNLQEDETEGEEGEEGEATTIDKDNTTNKDSDPSSITNSEPSASSDINFALSTTETTYQMTDTNCANACVPKLKIAASANQQFLTLFLEFPDSDECGVNKNLIISQTEEMFNGLWDDTNEQSVLHGYSGVYRFNNKTHYFTHRHPDNDGEICYEEWVSDESILSSTTGISEWEGLWKVTGIDVATGGSCCVPDVAVLLFLTLETQSITYSGRYPDCESCGSERASMFMHSISVVGGGGIDEQAGGSIYYVDGKLFYVSPSCAITYELIPPTSCEGSSNDENVVNGDSAATSTNEENGDANGDTANATEGEPTGADDQSNDAEDAGETGSGEGESASSGDSASSGGN